MAKRKIIVLGLGQIYRRAARPLFFTQSADKIHERVTDWGAWAGNKAIAKTPMGKLLSTNYPELETSIAGIDFKKPLGLAAGFDYQAKLVEVTPLLDFGFHTIGTITNLPCPGNPGPQLGRLPRSKSLLVNKGFKNPGAKAVIKKLGDQNFAIPLGVSIGRTNIAAIKSKADSIDDILAAFQKFEQSPLKHAFYELNISCPNLGSRITFCSDPNLSELLRAVFALKLTKPVFVKMPIDKTDHEIKLILDTLAKYPIAGIIIGNLQKDRLDPSFDPQEIKRAGKGNFSGKPTRRRSNELIALAYKHTASNLPIIGTGGVFSAADAYEKIKAGASLIQILTGLVFQGPQVVSEIHHGLSKLLKKDGFRRLTDAVGINHR